MPKQRHKPDKGSAQGKQLNRRNKIITAIVGITAILAFLLSLPKTLVDILALYPTATTQVPMLFPTAQTDESLIIVADFENRSEGIYKGIDPAQYVYEQLVAQIKKDNLTARVERLRQVVDDNTAKPVGGIYGATLVVWGWYDTLSITPRITRIKTLQGKASDQEGSRMSLAEPDKVEFSVVTDLPSQTAYLVSFTLAMDKFSNTKFDEALVYFDSAIQAIPPDANASTNPAEAYLFRAYTFYELSNYSHAIIDLDKAIQLKSGYTDAYNNRGNAYSHEGDYDRAIADYDRAIELNPVYSIPYYNRGLAHFNKGDYDRAITDYDKAIELNPDYALAYNNRGFTFYTKRNYPQAVVNYNKAIQLNPDNAFYYNNLGYAYLTIGSYDLAIANFDKAIQINPEYTFAYNNRGLAYFDKADYAPALTNYDKAIQLNPDYALAYFNRGILYKVQGKNSDATKDFERVLQLTQDDPYWHQQAEDELKTLR